MSPKVTNLNQFGGDQAGSDTPADLPSLAEFPAEQGDHERLVGLQMDRRLVYHRASHELHIYDPSDYEVTGNLEKVDQANTGGFGTRRFEEFRDNLQRRDWLATTAYGDVFIGDVDTARYPPNLPSDADQGQDDRPGERLIGVDAWGLGHYEVYEVDIPYIRRYAPFGERGIIRWEPNYGGYVTPEDGLAHRRIAHYIVTTEVECQGWELLSEYGQSLVDGYLDELAPVRELVE